MHNKLTFFISLLLLIAVSMQAQPILQTYGVSPRIAAEDSMDIFTYRYSGLQNVGVGTKVYLMGTDSQGSLTNPTWTLTSMPDGSSATVSETQTEGDSVEYLAFIPDVAGVYTITFSSSGADTAITINAAMYLGVQAGDANCELCHSGAVNSQDQFTPWSETKHAIATEAGVNGEISSHFQASCLECHATGYDPYADNGGFDDYPFVFPGTLQDGNYESLKDSYPDAMELANVQCESCHGPGGNHLGVTKDARMVASLDPSPCGMCHDNGSRYTTNEEWSYSVHANPGYLDYAGGRSGCSDCHSGSGFVAYVKNGAQSPAEVPETYVFSCAVCHDPHDATNEYQLRLMTATLANGEEVELGGTGIICMDCHRARVDAVEYTDNYQANLSTHYGPHHGPQAEMLMGTNAVTWDEELPTSPHLQAITNSCVGCHMGAAGDGMMAGGHTFSMTTPDGEDNVEACADCHGDIGESFAEKKFYLNGVADHDGDGVAEGLQEEVEGLLEKLAELLPQVDGAVSISDSTVTQLEAQAGFNYFLVEEDRSLGIHNPEFTVSLLQLSIAKLKGTTYVVPDVDSGLPSDYVLSQNYPNPFNPSTKINFSIPEQANVKITVYDALGKEVETLVNETMSAGKYTTEWNASRYASGIYFYKIATNNFVEVKKMILVK